VNDDDVSRTFPGGMRALASRMHNRKTALKYDDGESLPPLDADLDAIAARTVPEHLDHPGEGSSSYARKWHAIASEMPGQSELAVLHGVLIAHLRKRAHPAHAPALFRRLWAEKRDRLFDMLTTRWLISAVITYADVGETELDRRLAQSLNILFSLMKLYEAERLYSGFPPDRPFDIKDRLVADLPMGMPNFALVDGDLEGNLLAPIWLEARESDGVGPLALELLERLNRDPGTLFRRLAALRRDTKALRWNKRPKPG
jgi:hypothetical protein